MSQHGGKRARPPEAEEEEITKDENDASLTPLEREILHSQQERQGSDGCEFCGARPATIEPGAASLAVPLHGSRLAAL